METNYASIWSFISMCLIAVIGIGMLMAPAPVEPEYPTSDEIATSILNGITIPTAADIASAMPETDTSSFDEIWEGIYADEIDTLESEAFIVSMDEFDEDEIDDLFDDEYEDYDSFEYITDDSDDVEYNIINLGLDDEDDREIELTATIKVRVFYDDGYEDDKDKVYITSLVTSDDDELEADVTYSLTK